MASAQKGCWSTLAKDPAAAEAAKTAPSRLVEGEAEVVASEALAVKERAACSPTGAAEETVTNVEAGEREKREEEEEEAAGAEAEVGREVAVRRRARRTVEDMMATSAAVGAHAAPAMDGRGGERERV